MNHHALDRDGVVIRTEPGFTVVRVEHANVIFQVDELNYTNDSEGSVTVELVKAFAAAGKPIAAICHGPWTLVEAGPVEGKTLTSWPSLHHRHRQCGGSGGTDVFICPTQGFDLVTSRKPDDLDAFGKALVTTFARVVR